MIELKVNLQCLGKKLANKAKCQLFLNFEADRLKGMHIPICFQ